jgi:pimeloyl-ACP methyl ester carboxylesterase
MQCVHHTLHVEEFGAGDPVVLLHSSGLSGRQWRRLVPNLVDRGWRAVVPDLTGHGASAAWEEPKPFSFRNDVDEIALLLASQGPSRIVGHSYGGLVALQAALAAAVSIRSLVLFDPVAFGTLDARSDVDALAELSGVDFRWGPTADVRERWLEAFVDYWGGHGAWDALREEVRAEFRRVGWVVHEGVRSLVEDTTRAPAYGTFDASVLLLTGEESPLAAQRVVRRLGESLPHSRTVTIPGVGHMGPLTRPDLVNPVILDALNLPKR